MSLEKPVIAIVGAGAVGGYYGARLAQAGFDVHFLLRSDYETVRKTGWIVQSCDGDFTIPAEKSNVYNDPARMPKADLVIVTLKTTANPQLRALVEPLVKEDTVLLTLQNGLGNEELLAEHFGAHRVLGGMAFVCINRLAGGIIHHMDHGTIRLGEFNRPASERARRIAAMFTQSKVECFVLDNLKYGRWLKLVWNIPFNGLGTALDLTTDRLLANPAGLGLVTDLMREVIAIAKSEGIDLPDNVIELNIEHTQSMGAYRTSMQIDRLENRPLEHAAILGVALSVAEKNGVSCPILGIVHRAISCINR